MPGKNIRLCAGKPLLAWTAEAAKASQLDRVILSTDDEEIARVGRDLGIDVPFLRPADLARDETPSLPVVQHLLAWLESSGERVSSIVLLQPTSPLREARHIDGCIELFERSKAESVVSVMDVPPFAAPTKMMAMRPDGMVVKADPNVSGEIVFRNGPAVLITAPHVIKSNALYGQPTAGYRMDRFSSLDIDDDDDFILAELLLRRRDEQEGHA